MATKGETRLSLGEDIFLTLSEYRSEPRIHVRRFIPGVLVPNRLYPTKYGIVMTPAQFKTLTEVLPPLIEDLFVDDPPQDVAPIELGADLFLAMKTLYFDEIGTREVNIRKYYRRPEQNNELLPSLFGVTLSPKQTLSLFYKMNDILNLLPSASEHADPLHVQQQRSDTDFTPNSVQQEGQATTSADNPTNCSVPPEIANTIASWRDSDFTPETYPKPRFSCEPQEMPPPPAKKPRGRPRLKLNL